MKALKVTTPHEDGSYHVVYVNSESGVGAIAEAEGHTHELIWDPPRPPREATPAIPPQIDPMTGAPMINPETGQPDMGQPADPGDPGKEVGSWIVRPGGEDMHEHEVVDYVAKPERTKETEKEIIDECYALWRQALDDTRDSREKGREAYGFYKGDGQWKPSVKKEIERLDRAALTINEVQANIDTLIGYQMEQRTDLRYLPQEGGDQRVADMLNVISKRVLDDCYFQREETKVFRDEVIPGFGAFNVFMDFNSTIQGDIHVERFPWEDIVYGPHEKEDLSDCEYEVKSRMQSIAKLKQMFPKKAKEIETSYELRRGQYPDADKGNNASGTNTDYRLAQKIDDCPQTIDGDVRLVDIQKKQYRLAQVTRKMYRDVTVIFNQDENFFFTAHDWRDDDVAAAATMPGFQSITQSKPRMRITKFCGSVLLSDENPADLPVHDFFTVPVYAYRQDGEYWGKVESAKDPQRELNKRRSQIMDTMNRVGASVIYVEPETFTDTQEEEKFKKNRSKPGSIFKVNNLDRKPHMDNGADVPVALIQIMQLDQQNLQRLMNVVVEQAGANESGAMFLEKKKGRLTGNQFLFDNMSFAKQKLGRLILALIQRYYPAERLYDLLNSQNSRQPFQVAGQDFSQFSREEIIDMLETTDLLEYDVIVTESSFAASTRLAVAKVLFEAMGQGAAIPPELPLEFIDMPSDIRTRVTEGLQQQADATAQAQADVSNAEVTKTLLAKGQYTIAPERAQELGLVPIQQNGVLANPEQGSNNANSIPQSTEYADNLASSLAG